MTTNGRTSTASITNELVGPLVASRSCFLTHEMTIGAEVENPLLKVLLTFSPLIWRSMKERTDLQGKDKGDFRVVLGVSALCAKAGLPALTWSANLVNLFGGVQL